MGWQGHESHSTGEANAPPTFGLILMVPRWEHAPPTFSAVMYYVYLLLICSQQINRINAFSRKAHRFGLCSSTCLCDVSNYLRLVDSRLFNRIQSPSHCLSHLLPLEKHHLSLRPRGHSYTLPICPNNLYKSSFMFILFFLIID